MQSHAKALNVTKNGAQAILRSYISKCLFALRKFFARANYINERKRDCARAMHQVACGWHELSI